MNIGYTAVEPLTRVKNPTSPFPFFFFSNLKPVLYYFHFCNNCTIKFTNLNEHSEISFDAKAHKS